MSAESPTRERPSKPAVVGLLRQPLSQALLVAVGAFAIVSALFAALDHNLFIGDVGWYWRDSSRWREPFNLVHVPGYPLLVALLRGLTGNALEAAALMVSITFVAQVVGTWLAFRTIEVFASTRAALAGACLYVLWPLVGTNYAAFPVSDSVGKAVLVAALSFLVRRRYLAAGLFLGLTTVAHKGLWVPAALLACLMIVQAVREGDRPRAIGAALLSAAPITVLWIAGARHHGAVDWLFTASIRTEAKSHSALPIADGMFGSMVHGGAAGAVKGLMTLAVLVVAVAVVVAALRTAAPTVQRWAAIAIAGPIALLTIVLNQNTIFASIRFTPLLAIPLAWYFGHHVDRLAPAEWRRAAVAGGVVLLAVQLAYAAYIADFYRGMPPG
jgi:hypothetical protein